MIVVAVIGVLTTIGVPTFRRMIQKAKQTEARAQLGALYRAEATFRAEYSVYTNFIKKLRLESPDSNAYYAFGFFDEDGQQGDCPGAVFSQIAPSLDPWYTDIGRQDGEFAKVPPDKGVTSGYCPTGTTDLWLPLAEVQKNGSGYVAGAENLKEEGYDLRQMPIVFQFNKRDVPNPIPLKVLRSELNTFGAPEIEAVALEGRGVFDTLKEISKGILKSLRS